MEGGNAARFSGRAERSITSTKTMVERKAHSEKGQVDAGGCLQPRVAAAVAGPPGVPTPTKAKAGGQERRNDESTEPRAVEEEPDGYGSDTTYTGLKGLVDSSSSEGEAKGEEDPTDSESSASEGHCVWACRCEAAKCPRPAATGAGRKKTLKTRWDRRQGQRVLNELKFEEAKGKEGLRPLKVIEPEGVNELEVTGEWEEIEMAVDSGATETVVGEGDLLSVETKEGPASKRGTEYEVANGVRIPNLGEKVFTGVSDDGARRSITAQVCEVDKPQISVSRVCQHGQACDLRFQRL